MTIEAVGVANPGGRRSQALDTVLSFNNEVFLLHLCLADMEI